MGISSYSTTPASNTSISGINIAEGCNPSGINDAIRQMMADIASGVQLAQVPTSTGTGTALVVALSPAKGAYAAGDRFQFIANVDATGGATTINYGTTGAVSLRKKAANGSYVNPAALDFRNGSIVDVEYDGTQVLLMNAPTNSQGADIVSAATVNLDTATGDYVNLTGTTGTTAITLSQGREVTVRYAGAVSITAGASLIPPTGATMTTEAGDAITWRGEASGVVRAVGGIKASGQAWAWRSNTTPQGRLTLTTLKPVMDADATAQTTVYYTPFVGNNLPIYNGSIFVDYAFSQLSLALNTTDNTNGNIYDIFAWNDAGTLRIGTGPAWTTATAGSGARGTGAGTTELAVTNGLYTNANSITLRNGGTSYAGIAANRATFLGSVYMTANGQTAMAFRPNAAAGGTNNILGLDNAYNRVMYRAQCRDSTASWTYASATWRAANNNNSNRITVLDCLGRTRVETCYSQYAASAILDAAAAIGVNQNSNSATPVLSSFIICPRANNGAQATSGEQWAPILGLSYYQAMEQVGSAVTYSFSGSANQRLTLSMEM
jgi:hypothetical protein